MERYDVVLRDPDGNRISVSVGQVFSETDAIHEAKTDVSTPVEAYAYDDYEVVSCDLLEVHD